MLFLRESIFFCDQTLRSPALSCSYLLLLLSQQAFKNLIICIYFSDENFSEELCLFTCTLLLVFSGFFFLCLSLLLVSFVKYLGLFDFFSLLHLGDKGY